MSQTELEARLREAFPGAEIVVEDLAGDGDHYRARIVSAAFQGLNRIGQHRCDLGAQSLRREVPADTRPAAQTKGQEHQPAIHARQGFGQAIQHRRLGGAQHQGAYPVLQGGIEERDPVRGLRPGRVGLQRQAERRYDGA